MFERARAKGIVVVTHRIPGPKRRLASKPSTTRSSPRCPEVRRPHRRQGRVRPVRRRPDGAPPQLSGRPASPIQAKYRTSSRSSTACRSARASTIRSRRRRTCSRRTPTSRASPFRSRGPIAAAHVLQLQGLWARSRSSARCCRTGYALPEGRRAERRLSLGFRRTRATPRSRSPRRSSQAAIEPGFSLPGLVRAGSIRPSGRSSSIRSRRSPSRMRRASASDPLVSIRPMRVDR